MFVTIPGKAGVFMENTNNPPERRPNPRRRRRSRMQIFKQTYLPAIIVILVIVLFIIFAIGSINRSKEKKENAIKESIAAQESREAMLKALQEEVDTLLDKAGKLYHGYDYQAAIDAIDSFSGDVYEFPDLLEIRDNAATAQQSLVAWSDPTKIVNLGFHILVADGAKAFADKENGTMYKWNFLTVSEFSAILEQLYAGGYVLVDLDDVITRVTLADGTTSYSANTIYLPQGRTPIMISQTQVNYYSYMVDTNDDGAPDQSTGFAYQLTPDLKNKILTIDGELTGNYDLVPILEDFIAKHPDFSYRGARATIGVNGYDGVLGYRNKQLGDAEAVVNALRAAGYTIACNTYANKAYGLIGPESISKDLTGWTDNIKPIVGNVDVLCFAKNSDIAEAGLDYDGEKYQVLKDAGFRWYLGFCEDGEPWVNIGADYVRIGRLMVTGNAMSITPELYEGLFDVATVMDSVRK